MDVNEAIYHLRGDHARLQERAAEPMVQGWKWIYEDDERPQDPLRCYDCGLLYGSESWMDAHVQDEVWARIAPTKHGGGVLCIACMARRCVNLGLSETNTVPIQIGSGPFDAVPDQDRAEPTVRKLQETLRKFSVAIGGDYKFFGLHSDFILTWRECTHHDITYGRGVRISDSTPAGFIAKVEAKTAELLEAKEKA